MATRGFKVAGARHGGPSHFCPALLHGAQAGRSRGDGPALPDGPGGCHFLLSCVRFFLISGSWRPVTFALAPARGRRRFLRAPLLPRPPGCSWGAVGSGVTPCLVLPDPELRSARGSSCPLLPVLFCSRRLGKCFLVFLPSWSFLWAFSGMSSSGKRPENRGRRPGLRAGLPPRALCPGFTQGDPV